MRTHYIRYSTLRCFRSGAWWVVLVLPCVAYLALELECEEPPCNECPLPEGMFVEEPVTAFFNLLNMVISQTSKFDRVSPNVNEVTNQPTKRTAVLLSSGRCVGGRVHFRPPCTTHTHTPCLSEYSLRPIRAMFPHR